MDVLAVGMVHGLSVMGTLISGKDRIGITDDVT